MTLLDRYIAQQLSTYTLFLLVLFVIAWVAPEIMFNAIEEVSGGDLTAKEGVLFILYKMPEVLVYCAPISTLIASVLFFRRFSLSLELISVLSSGVSFKRLLIPVGVVGVGLSLLFFCSQEFLKPWTSNELMKLYNKAGIQSSSFKETDPLVTFSKQSPEGDMRRFLIIAPKATDDRNKFVFLFYQGHGKDTRIRTIVTALRGNWHPTTSEWELLNGVEYSIDKYGIYQAIAPFAAKRIQTNPVVFDLLQFPGGNPSGFPLAQLGEYVQLLHRGGQNEDARFYEVRLYQRYFLPLVPFIFALIGATIGIEHTRTHRNMGLTYATILLLFYNIMIPSSTTLGSIGILPALIAAFLPIALAIGGGLFIVKLRRSEG